MRHAQIARILLTGLQLVLAGAMRCALLAGVRPELLPDPRISGFEFPSAKRRGQSCHPQATYPLPHHAAPRFTDARYVNLGDPSFVGTLQTEFLWALQRHAR